MKKDWFIFEGQVGKIKQTFLRLNLSISRSRSSVQMFNFRAAAAKDSVFLFNFLFRSKLKKLKPLFRSEQNGTNDFEKKKHFGSFSKEKKGF